MRAKYIQGLLVMCTSMMLFASQEEQISRGIMSSNGFYSYVLTPSDLTCYPYEITKPGHYILTRDFKHIPVSSKAGQPLIKILSDNVTLDLQGFMLYQDTTQFVDVSDFVHSNLIEIGSGNPVVMVSNVTVKNGTLFGASGMAIQSYAGCNSLSFQDLNIVQSAFMGMALFGNTNVRIDRCVIEHTGYYQTLQSLFTDFIDDYAPLFSIYKEPDMGIVGLMLVSCVDVQVVGCKITDTSTPSMNSHTYGLYLYGGSDAVIKKTTISETYAGKISKPLRLRYTTQVDIQDCTFMSNIGSGMRVISAHDSSSISIKGCHFKNNSARGSFLNTSAFVDAVKDGAAVPAYSFADNTQLWSTDPVLLVNARQAYSDYKAAITSLKSGYADQSYLQANNSNLVQGWTSAMNASNAVDYALSYYTNISRAYGMELVRCSYVQVEENIILHTYAIANSAYGIMCDDCTQVTLSKNKIISTQAFASVSGPLSDSYVADFLRTIFGTILYEDDSLVTGETLSLLGRAVGVEIRNMTSKVSVEDCLISDTYSAHVFAAGIFFNRALQSRVTQCWFEHNMGSDFGYGFIDRIVDPTDVIAHCTFYANGYTTDLNRNWGMVWSSTGKFSSKHVFPGDLDLANNVGPYENLEILFDGVTELNLYASYPLVDVAEEYISVPV